MIVYLSKFYRSVVLNRIRETVYLLALAGFSASNKTMISSVTVQITRRQIV